jgi:hypothetical protein
MQVVHASRTPERTRTIAFVVFALAFVCALLAFLPQPAWAKSHSCTKDVIEATVNTDGSLHVVDSRTYSFEGSYTLTAAVLSPPNNGTYKVNGVSVIDSSGNKTALKKVEFQRAMAPEGRSRLGQGTPLTRRRARFMHFRIPQTTRRPSSSTTSTRTPSTATTTAACCTGSSWAGIGTSTPTT